MSLNGLECMGKGFPGADPEMRYIGQSRDRAVVELSIAFQRSYQKNGEWVRESHFVPVVFYGKLAERFNAQVRKGKLVIVSGYLEQYSYTHRESGKKVVRHRVVANDFWVVEREANGNGGGKTGAPQDATPSENDAPPVNEPKPSDPEPGPGSEEGADAGVEPANENIDLPF